MSYLANQLKRKQERYSRRKRRTNAQVKSHQPEVRVLVSKSNKYISAQAIDLAGKVIATVSDKKTAKGDKKANAFAAGQEFAKLLKDKKVEKVAFDRNGFLYHGRVASFADGLRDGGMSV